MMIFCAPVIAATLALLVIAYIAFGLPGVLAVVVLGYFARGL